MLRKMKAREYALPESLGLSAPCVSLLRRLLEPDENARIVMEEIMQDPWFLTDLPPDALRMNDRYLASSRPCTQTEAQIRAIVQAATADHEPRWGDQLNQ
ncbi:Snf1-like ser/thr protein kinase [Monoraphidium neglectum]|uniref:Snf1-like ser/thr protein kinase n=1 Tax=Monoraphidium neglectum TaxID=145388 RepID=A0A0D2M2I7_9CHLO|nr:Snf1-like ser/thr protein kinase [Monoraphidium neglectum]KIY97859.1 Snf1-like ser/thr protein kinase [Monoraphidium neglectum]|eukprot:XP_013896879.1 Snf1-like ser/thr protein kinase [Monoraphidium neglectum]